jgi:hypothetical protein
MSLRFELLAAALFMALWGRALLLSWRGVGPFRLLYLRRPYMLGGRRATFLLATYANLLFVLLGFALLFLFFVLLGALPDRLYESYAWVPVVFLATAVLGWFPVAWLLARLRTGRPLPPWCRGVYPYVVAASLIPLTLLSTLAQAFRPVLPDGLFLLGVSVLPFAPLFVARHLAHADPDWSLPPWYREWRREQRRLLGPSTDLGEASERAAKEVREEMRDTALRTALRLLLRAGAGKPDSGE